MQNRFFLVTAFFLGVILTDIPPATASAVKVNDGFKAARRIQSRYFDICIESGVDEDSLAMRLSVPASIRTIVRKAVSTSYDVPSQMDMLYLAVSEILDIHLTDFTCTVKICRDRKSLSRIAMNLFGQRMSAGGFYIATIDTLYVDAENVSLNILGHEMGHAIQTHYFVVPPPVKVQEVLSGYVEYQLRKYTNTLPE